VLALPRAGEALGEPLSVAGRVGAEEALVEEDCECRPVVRGVKVDCTEAGDVRVTANEELEFAEGTALGEALRLVSAVAEACEVALPNPAL
jgi:hypothetical protein